MVVTTAQLRSQGLSTSEIATALRRGERRRLRRGVYDSGPTPVDATVAHRQLVAATLPLLHSDAVVSHASAAVLHDLPLVRVPLDRVHVTRDRPTGADRRTSVHVHSGPLHPDEVVLVGGLRVTSVARTVTDLARSLPPATGLVVADASLRSGATADELDHAARRATRWPGIRRGRQVIALASPLAESPAESISRWRCLEFGLPLPILQYEVRNAFGRLLACTDFGWPEFGTVGEVDGKVKYTTLLRRGESPGDAVYREKRREDLVRDEDLQVVRWGWDDLWHFGPTADRIRRAFARGTPHRVSSHLTGSARGVTWG